MGPCRLLKTIFAQFLGKYRVVSALFGKIERLTFTGTFDAFQHLVKSHSFKQICFPHRSEMGVLKSFLKFFFAFSLLTCYAFIPDVRGSTEMTNPIRRQIQEHPACDTHRPRPHAEGFLRRSGREVECTPLLRVQVRIRASGVRIPPSPP